MYVLFQKLWCHSIGVNTFSVKDDFETLIKSVRKTITPQPPKMVIHILQCNLLRHGTCDRQIGVSIDKLFIY